MKMYCTSWCEAERRSKYPYSEDLIKFNKTIIPFALVWYEIGYSKVSATHLVGYLPFHIQCALIKKLLNIALKWIKSLRFFFKEKLQLWRSDTCFTSGLKKLNKICLVCAFSLCLCSMVTLHQKKHY